MKSLSFVYWMCGISLLLSSCDWSHDVVQRVSNYSAESLWYYYEHNNGNRDSVLIPSGTFFDRSDRMKGLARDGSCIFLFTENDSLRSISGKVLIKDINDKENWWRTVIGSGREANAICEFIITDDDLD